MNGRLIPVRDIRAGDELRWRELAGRALDPNPLGEPDCVVPAAHHQAFGSEIALAVVEQGDRFVASLPLRPLRNWYDIRYPVMANRIRRGANIGSPLIDPEVAPEAVEMLFRTLRQEGRHLGRLVGLDSLRVGGTVERLLMETADRLGLQSYVREDFERGFLIRKPTCEYTGHLSSKYLLKVRRNRRRLTEYFGRPPVLRDRAQEPGAIDDFVELEAAGYKGDNVALASMPGDPESFREMCAAFAQEDRLRVLSLEAGGMTLAMVIWLRGGDGFLALKTAYDERFRRCGPGIILHLDSFKYFHEQTDANWIDTCASPDNEILLKLFPDRTRISTRLFSLGGRIDGAFVGTFLPARARIRRELRPLKRVVERVRRSARQSEAAD